MKIGYTGIFNEAPTLQKYHGWGYTKTNLDQLAILSHDISILNTKSDFNNYDAIFIDEGVNFTNLQWNKPGGEFTKTINNLHKLNNYHGKIYYNALKEFPNYEDLIIKRKLNIDFSLKSTPNGLYFADYYDRLILGDSHATSVWQAGWCINSINGKTLHSYLNDNIKSYVPKNIKKLRFYAGNIDIRFHYHRLNVNINDVVVELEKQLKELNIDIEIIQPLPIENESRQMSSTMGSYKGKPFYGTQLERTQIRNDFDTLLNKICLENNWTYHKWQNIYDNQFLNINCMEPKRGPHLSPIYYMFK